MTTEDANNADTLYAQAMAMACRFPLLSERELRVLIAIAEDAKEKYGVTNHDRRVELVELIEAAERALPVESVDGLRQRVEAWIFGLVPSSRAGRVFLLCVGLIVVAAPLLLALPYESAAHVIRQHFSRDIVVWKIGSPWRGGTPAATIPREVESLALKNGVRVTAIGVPADNFADKLLEAHANNELPDAIAIDNYGLIDGIETDRGRFDGIGEDGRFTDALVNVSESLSRLNKDGRGWVFLINGSRQHRRARQLALSIENCSTTDLTGFSSPQPQRDKITSSIKKLAAQYVSCEALGPGTPIPSGLRTLRCKGEEPPKVKSVEICDAAGTPRLLLATVGVIFDSEKSVGRKDILVGITAEGDALVPLFVTDDSYSVQNFLSPDEANDDRSLKEFMLEVRDCSDQRRTSPGAGELITPPKFKRKTPGSNEEFPLFTWRSSASSDIAFEIVEFRIGNALSRTFFRSTKPNDQYSISSGHLMSSEEESSWRVLSVNHCGDIAKSDFRPYQDDY